MAVPLGRFIVFTRTDADVRSWSVSHEAPEWQRSNLRSVFATSDKFDFDD